MGNGVGVGETVGDIVGEIVGDAVGDSVGVTTRLDEDERKIEISIVRTRRIKDTEINTIIFILSTIIKKFSLIDVWLANQNGVHRACYDCEELGRSPEKNSSVCQNIHPTVYHS